MRLSTLFSLVLSAGCSLGSEGEPAGAAEPVGAAAGEGVAGSLSTKNGPPELDVETARLDLVVSTDAGRTISASLTGTEGTIRYGNRQGRTGAVGSLTFDLTSWSSGAAKCDQAVQEVLFDVSRNPTATFSLASLEPASPWGLEEGDRTEATVTGTAYVAGGRAELVVPVRVTRDRADFQTLEVRSSAPVSVSLEALGFAEPLQDVMRVCGYASVADEVSVSATVRLRAAGEPESEASQDAGSDTETDTPAAVPARADSPSPAKTAQPSSRTLDSLRPKRTLEKLGKRKLGKLRGKSKSKSKSKRSP